MNYLEQQQIDTLKTHIKSISIYSDFIKYSNGDMNIKFKFPNCLSNNRIVEILLNIYNTHTNNYTKYKQISNLILDDSNFIIRPNDMVLYNRLTYDEIEIYENSYELVTNFIEKNRNLAKKMEEILQIVKSKNNLEWNCSFTNNKNVVFTNKDSYYIYKKIIVDLTNNNIIEYGLEYVYTNNDILDISKIDDILELLDELANKFRQSIETAGSDFAVTSGKFIGINYTLEDFYNALKVHDIVFRVVNINCFHATLCSPDIYRNINGEFSIRIKQYKDNSFEYDWNYQRFKKIEDFLECIRTNYPRLLR